MKCVHNAMLKFNNFWEKFFEGIEDHLKNLLEWFDDHGG